MAIQPIVGKFKKAVITDLWCAIGAGLIGAALYYQFQYVPYMERVKYVYEKINEEKKDFVKDI